MSYAICDVDPGQTSDLSGHEGLSAHTTMNQNSCPAVFTPQCAQYAFDMGHMRSKSTRFMGGTGPSCPRHHTHRYLFLPVRVVTQKDRHRTLAVPYRSVPNWWRRGESKFLSKFECYRRESAYCSPLTWLEIMTSVLPSEAHAIVPVETPFEQSVFAHQWALPNALCP